MTDEAVATYLRRVEQLRQAERVDARTVVARAATALDRRVRLGGRLNVGSWLISAFALALVALGGAAYGNGHLRGESSGSSGTSGISDFGLQLLRDED